MRAASFARRFVYFWIVWSALLLVHEGAATPAIEDSTDDSAFGQIVMGVDPAELRAAARFWWRSRDDLPSRPREAALRPG